MDLLFICFSLMARNRQEPKDTISITNNNKIVARGPLLEIFSIVLNTKLKKEFKILLCMKKGEVTQSQINNIKGMCKVKNKYFYFIS